MSETSPDLDERIRECVEAGDLDEATELALEAYQTELYNYIRKITEDPVLADEAFQQFSLQLWEDWETFRWNSTVKTWAYRIARNSAYDVVREKSRRKERHFRTDEQKELVAKWTRTATKNFRKTEAKHWLWDVIQEFDTEDRELLVLRLGNKMTWKEVARVVEGDDLGDDELRRASNRLRKRFQRLKGKLREHRDEFDDVS